MRQEMMEFGDAVALAGPYANNLHLAPDMTTLTPHHSVFLVAGCSSWCLTNSVKALKATGAVTGQNVPLVSSVLVHQLLTLKAGSVTDRLRAV